METTKPDNPSQSGMLDWRFHCRTGEGEPGCEEDKVPSYIGARPGISNSRMHTGNQRYYVYMLECRGGRLYTGITTDIERRFAEHRAGRKGARFTRAHPPARLLAVTKTASRSEALKLEAALKRLRRTAKLAWAQEHAVTD